MTDTDTTPYLDPALVLNQFTRQRIKALRMTAHLMETYADLQPLESSGEVVLFACDKGDLRKIRRTLGGAFDKTYTDLFVTYTRVFFGEVPVKIHISRSAACEKVFAGTTTNTLVDAEVCPVCRALLDDGTDPDPDRYDPRRVHSSTCTWKEPVKSTVLKEEKDYYWNCGESS